MNPNRTKHKHSPDAGRKKGSISWNKGKTFQEEALQRSRDFFAEGKYSECVEAVARKHAKRLIIHTRGHRCEVCGTTEWNNQPVPLICDHISGDSSDNTFANFRVVCCNCDAQLPTFKSKNKGRGREYDRRYHQWKANPTVGDGT